MRSQRIDFRTFDESHITYGNRAREVKYTQGTTPEDFVRIYQELSNKYGLCVTEDFLSRFYHEVYEKDLSLTERLELPFPYINYLVGFVLDTHYLLEKGVNIRPLISEFNKSNNSSELRHTIHLSVIAAVYTSGGYSIEFLRKSKSCKTADLTINGIPADLKLIKPTDLKNVTLKRARNLKVSFERICVMTLGKLLRIECVSVLNRPILSLLTWVQNHCP